MTSGLEERIGTLLAQHRPELEQLVDQALERELAQLVEQRLAGRKGVETRNSYPQVGKPPTAATKTCNGCGRELGLDRFEKNRGRCRECRRRDHEAREQRRTEPEPAAEPDRPTAISANELAARVDHYGAANAREIERWLVDEKLAEQTPAGLVVTARGLELAAAID